MASENKIRSDIKDSVICPPPPHMAGQNGPEMSCPPANEVGVCVCVQLKGV